MNELLQTLIHYLLLFGGFSMATLLVGHHRKNHPDQGALTATLSSRAWNMPQIGILLGGLLLCYFLASFIGLFFYEEQIPLARLVITATIYALLITGVAAINWRQTGSWKFNCGMGRSQLKKLALAPLFYLAAIPFLMLATTGYHFLLEHLIGMEVEMQDVAKIITQKLSWLEILYILTAIFIAPVYEEILFRGILFPFLTKHIGPVQSALFVSALFALMHFHLPSLVPLFLLSIALCGVYWRTESLWPSIGMHAIFNTVSILAIHFSK